MPIRLCFKPVEYLDLMFIINKWKFNSWRVLLNHVFYVVCLNITMIIAFTKWIVIDKI